MKKTEKLQELVSNQVANAIATVKNSAKSGSVENKKSSTKTGKKETTKTSKRKEVTKEVTHQQNTAILEQVISQREVKYIYPDDVKDTLSRKRWRQQTRNELHRLEREMYRIKNQNSKEFKEAKEAYETFKAEVLKPAQTA